MICSIFYAICLYRIIFQNSVTIISVKIISLGIDIVVFFISIRKGLSTVMSHIHISHNTAIFSYSFLYLQQFVILRSTNLSCINSFKEFKSHNLLNSVFDNRIFCSFIYLLLSKIIIFSTFTLHRDIRIITF